MQRRAVDVLKSGRLVSFVAASLIFLAALIDALLYFGVTAGHPPDPLFFDFVYARTPRISAATVLSEEFLRLSWDWNLAAFPSLLASDLLLSLGLFGVAYVAWVRVPCECRTRDFADTCLFAGFDQGISICWRPGCQDYAAFLCAGSNGASSGLSAESGVHDGGRLHLFKLERPVQLLSGRGRARVAADFVSDEVSKWRRVGDNAFFSLVSL